MGARLVSVHRRLAALALALASGGCGGGAAEDAAPLHDMRQVMFAIEGFKRAVEPLLRDPTRLPEIEQHLAGSAAWTRDPVFERWVETPVFYGDPARFLSIRSQLLGATEAARAAAERGDLDALRQEFIGMTMTCIACHKRYQPNY